MPLADFEEERKKRSPMLWIVLIVVVLIVFFIFGTDRGGRQDETTQPEPQVTLRKTEGQVDRQDAAPSGAQARELISSYRGQDGTYPFDDIMASASEFASSGDIADAHLLLFFAAREGHVDAMMKLAEKSDPTRFQPENNLLDRADAIQAYKWYRMALDKGHRPARARLDNLHQWAMVEAEQNNPTARQLLLNFD